MSIKPLVSLLHIGLSTEKVLSLYQEINDHVNFRQFILISVLAGSFFLQCFDTVGYCRQCCREAWQSSTR